MTISPRQRAIALSVVALAAIALLSFGRLITHEDPLKKSDAIYVLGGAWIERWLESADLYNAGYAPHIVISEGGFAGGRELLKKRGLTMAGPGEISRSVMIEQMHLPPAAIEILPDSLDNTAQEASAIRTLAAARGWKRIIVITDRASTRRAGFAMRRELGPNVEIVMRGTRLDGFSPNDWWKSRGMIRTVFYELPKLISYWLGLKG